MVFALFNFLCDFRNRACSDSTNWANGCQTGFCAGIDLEKEKAIAGSTWALEEHEICAPPIFRQLWIRVRKSCSIIFTPFHAHTQPQTE
jgi:hypothetical protein